MATAIATVQYQQRPQSPAEPCTCLECSRPLTTALAQDAQFCDRSCETRYLRLMPHRAKEAARRAALVVTTIRRRISHV